MSVIVGRALPDVRDGLKPVHRRVLFAMHEAGLQPEPRRTASARASSASVMGNYHPHGDQAIYDTLVRLGQDFAHALPAGRRPGQLRLDRQRPARGDAVHRGAPRAAGHGDAARHRRGHRRLRRRTTTSRARSRSSCRRASRTCSSTARPGSPSAWPRTSRRTTCARRSTRWSPTSTIPEIDVDGLMKHIKGPDFPTGGIIVGPPGIRTPTRPAAAAWSSAARAHIEPLRQGKEAIIVTELPYQVTKGDGRNDGSGPDQEDRRASSTTRRSPRSPTCATSPTSRASGS